MKKIAMNKLIRSKSSVHAKKEKPQKQTKSKTSAFWIGLIMVLLIVGTSVFYFSLYQPTDSDHTEHDMDVMDHENMDRDITETDEHMHEAEVDEHAGHEMDPESDMEHTTSGEKPTLRIGYLPITHAILPRVVYEQGTLTKSNLELVKFTSWSDMEAAIKSGEIDGGGSILNTLTIKIRSEGTDINTLLLAVRDGSVLVVSNDINSPSQLQGKKIAVPSKHSPHYLLLTQFLVDNDLNYETDVETIILPPMQMVDALKQGDIDGYIVADPFGQEAVEQGVGKIMAFSKDINIPGSTGNECTISIRHEFIHNHPEATKEFIKQIILAGYWVEEHPEEAAELAANTYLTSSKETILKSLKDPEGRTSFINLYPNRDEFQSYQTYMIKRNILDSDNAIQVNDLIDESFAIEAYLTLREEGKI